jgi:hypothetical protein
MYQITFAKGINYFGRLKSTQAGNIMIITEEGEIIYHEKERIVYLNTYDKSFWERLSASIDLGLNITKANNLRQLNIRSALGYKGKYWSSDITFNQIFSTQNDVEDTRRSEGALNFKYLLFKTWYTTATVSTLSNNEQKLNLRLNALVGFGNFIIHTNKAYWGLKLGANRNFETYSNETPDRQSWEGYLGTELNLFDFGDLSLTADAMLYKGITDSERWRADAALDFKYDLPYDLYVKLGVSYNFDNRPAEGAGEHDYVIQNGIGWEW